MSHVRLGDYVKLDTGWTVPFKRIILWNWFMLNLIIGTASAYQLEELRYFEIILVPSDFHAEAPCMSSAKKIVIYDLSYERELPIRSWRCLGPFRTTTGWEPITFMPTGVRRLLYGTGFLCGGMLLLGCSALWFSGWLRWVLGFPVGTLFFFMGWFLLFAPIPW